MFNILGSCKSGYTELGGSCYREERNHDRDWLEAQVQCKKEGAHVISIDSMEEMEIITQVSCTICIINCGP